MKKALQKGFANILLIAVVVVLAGVTGYLALSHGTSVPSLIPSRAPDPLPVPTPAPAPAPGPEDVTAIVSLGEQFTLKKDRVVKVVDTGLEVKITAFYNSPCPQGVQCVWSGVGIGFEYRLNGQVQTGINLVQAFGHQTTIVRTDHETYANLVVRKME